MWLCLVHFRFREPQPLLGMPFPLPESGLCRAPDAGQQSRQATEETAKGGVAGLVTGFKVRRSCGVASAVRLGTQDGGHLVP
jgi:hypothetical protein